MPFKYSFETWIIQNAGSMVIVKIQTSIFHLLHRMEGLNSECIEHKKLLDQLQIDLDKQREYNETFKEVPSQLQFFLLIWIHYRPPFPCHIRWLLWPSFFFFHGV